MTDTEINRAISDAKQANEELFIRDENGKAFNNDNTFPNEREENSLDLDFANNLSSSTELETDVKREEKKYADRKDYEKLTQLSDIITQYVMITGTTVERLNSEEAPGQTQTDMETNNQI